MRNKWIRSQAKRLFLGLTFFLDLLLFIRELCAYQVKKLSPRILLCIANPASVGGTELQIQIIAEYLKKEWGQCLVLLSGKIEERGSSAFLNRLRTLGIPYLCLGSVGLIQYSRLPFLRRKIASLIQPIAKTVKICHFFNPSSTLFSPVVKEAGLRIFYMETGIPSFSDSNHLLKTMVVDFECVTSVSAAGLRNFEQLYGYAGPARVISSAIYPPPADLFSRQPKKNVFHIVYFGRMTKTKGVDLLLASFSDLLNFFPYATLSLIGFGEFLPHLKKLAREYRLEKSISFSNWLSSRELFPRLAASDLFCLPSDTEGMPCSILEAMSLGLAILATDVGGISELIEHNVSGLLVPPRDQQALTQALIQLAQNPDLRARLGKGALAAYQKQRSIENVMGELFAAYGTS